MSAIAAAIAALRREWPSVTAGESVPLDGSGRSAVLRLPISGAPVDSVVLKSYPPADGPGALENEAVAAALFTALPGEPIGPRLLACDLDARVLVLSDLGEHPALSDLLLGTDPAAAEAGLFAWAAALGRVAGRTRNPHDRIEVTQRQLGITRLNRPMEGWLRDAAGEFAGRAERRFGLTPPAGTDADLAACCEVLDPSPYDIFTPADACPDNNQLTPGGVRFLDFEFAGRYSLFLDAAYTALPFPMCWCVLRLPEAVAAGTAAAYRDAVLSAFPDLTGKPWDYGVLRACVLCIMAWIRPLLDGPPGDTESGAFRSHGVQFPGRAALAHHRLSTVLAMGGDALPSLMALLRTIDERLVAECGPLSVSLYPAFRAG